VGWGRRVKPCRSFFPPCALIFFPPSGTSGFPAVPLSQGSSPPNDAGRLFPVFSSSIPRGNFFPLGRGCPPFRYFIVPFFLIKAGVFCNSFISVIRRACRWHFGSSPFTRIFFLLFPSRNREFFPFSPPLRWIFFFVCERFVPLSFFPMIKILVSLAILGFFFFLWVCCHFLYALSRMMQRGLFPFFSCFFVPF